MDGSSGNLASRDELITDYLHVAEQVSRKHQRKSDFDDLYAEACLGIIYAIDKHLECPHLNLDGYVYSCANGYALEFLKKQNKSGAHIPSSTYRLAQQDATFDELVESGKSENRARQILNAAALIRTSSISFQDRDGEEGSLQIEDREESIPNFCTADVDSLLDRWATPREKKVLKMKFGIHCEEVPPHQIAKTIGVTLTRMRQISSSAMYKISRVRECKNCHESFDRGFYRRQYCSEECYHLLRRKREPVPCRHCGTLFFKMYGRTVFCTDECCLVFWSEKYRIKGKIKKSCKRCGQEFFSNRTRGYGKHRFCDKACWTEASCDDKSEDRPDFVHHVLIRKKGTSRFIKLRLCKTCDKEMKVNSLGTRKIFCDKECRARHLYPVQTCQQCGDDFYRKIKAKFCKYECSVIFKRENTKLGWAQCLICDTSFKKRKETSAFCSVGHANTYRARKSITVTDFPQPDRKSTQVPRASLRL